MTRSRPSKDPSRPLQLQRHPETPEYTMQEFVITLNEAGEPDGYYETLVPVPFDHAEKNPHAVELGRLGGLKGGRARAEALSPQQRREIARKAARTRWKNRNR